MNKEEKELNTAEIADKKEKKPFNKRKLKYGALATTVTVVFITVVVMINVVASMITERYPVKLDLTKNSLFEISQETEDYLKTVEKTVDISVLSNKTDMENSNVYTKQIVEIVEKYGMASDNIEVSFIDIEKEPTYVSKYSKIYSGEITAGQIVVASEKRAKVFAAMDLYESEMDYNTYQTKITGCKAENVLTSAIMNVIDENIKNAAFVTSTSSQSAANGVQYLKEMLEGNGYVVSDVDLLMADVPEDTDLLIVFAPYNDFTKSQIDKLSAYLQNDGKLGKNLCYVANFDQSETPNIDAFLEEWGIELGTGYLNFTDQASSQLVGISGMGNFYNVLMGNISDTSTYGTLVTNSDRPIVMPFPRPVVISENTANNISAVSLLQVPDTAALIPLDVDTSTFTPVAVGEPTDVITLSTKKLDGNESKILTVASAFFIDSYIAEDKNYNNSEFMINSFNLVTGKENAGFSVLPKSMSTETISLQTEDVSRLKIFILVIIPLMVAAAGVTVFIRRRNR